MATGAEFLEYFQSALKSIEEGEFDRVDLAGVQFADPAEAELLGTMRRVLQNLRSTVKQADAIAQGDYSAEISPRSERDQIGAALFKMTQALRDIARIAQAVSEGDYSTMVEVKGPRDRLAQSLNRMVHNLRRVTTEFDDQVWLKSGQAQVADCIRGELDLKTLCDNVTGFLARYVQAQVGVLYLLDGDSVLRRGGGYAIPKQQHEGFRLGEGVVGQAAAGMETIVVDDIPETYLTISSGLGQAVPRCIAAVPLLFEEQVCGVLELGSFHTFTNQQIAFLELVGEGIAVAIQSVKKRLETQMLLEETQRQAEELQAQAEELQTQQEQLRASNEELEEQTQQLMTSEEQLRVQSEELQSTNEELEEKTQYLERQKVDIEGRNRELEAVRRDLEARTADLTRASKYKSEFLANMSHELRTPLNSMLILSNSLSRNEDTNLTEKQVEAAGVIHTSGQDLLNLINDILDLSKVEAGRLDLEINDVAVTSIADRLFRQFEPVAANRDVTFETELDGDIPATIRTDVYRTEQILRNLLSNAFKFTEHGSVTLRFHWPTTLDSGGRRFGEATTGESARQEPRPPDATHPSLAISVIDTGIGIAPEKQQAIFDVFQQADGSTSRRFGGTGLGLTISRELARLLGGEIRLQSDEGEGSTFTLCLPIDGVTVAEEVNKTETPDTPVTPPEVQPSDDEPAEPVPLPPDAAFTGPAPEFIPDDRQQLEKGDKCMLIVEDDVRFARILLDISRRRGYRCLVAGRGSDALVLAFQFQPTAIMLDIGLPDITGLQVLEQLKANLETRHIPVHVISALDERPESLRHGAVGYVAKPASEEDIDRAFAKLEASLQSGVKRVLIVEDNDVQRNGLVEMISNKAVELTAVRTGEEARQAIVEQRFDCVILDLTLPDMTGFELLESVGKLGTCELPPVVVCTARELTREEHDRLCKYAESIVIKGANSLERVLDEVSLFLHSVERALSPQQQQTIRMLYDSEGALKGRKVLLVDDDARNTFALSAVLEQAGLEVTLADNGQLALDKLESEPEIDLVVMDLMMPVMDGYEATRRIRAQRRFEKLPIIAVTAKAMPEDRANCLQAGANDYLTKPVDVERLLSLMRVWLFRDPSRGRE